jgi:hypothetical protein
VIKAVIIHDGVETCTVGFLLHHVVSRSQEAAQLFLSKPAPNLNK